MAPRVDGRPSVTSVMVALAIVAIPLPVLGAAPEATPGPAVQVPEAERAVPPSDATTPPVQRPGGSAEAVPPPTDAAPSTPTPDATTPSEPTPVEAVPADALEAEPATPTTTPTPAPTVATTRPAASPSEELSPSEAITAEYAPRYRPQHNPGRFNLVVRGLFANAGGSKVVGGRLGGAAVDAGQSWNHFGYAVTGTVYGGRLVMQDASREEINALIGVGPTVGLGRLALLGRGFLDLRLGYDFYYGVVNRRDDETVSGGDPGDVTVTKAKNLVPHGPRVRLDLGLLSLDTRRRFFHGFGVSMGYQALVGSMGDTKMPPIHMLTIGLTYWMG